MLEILGDHRGVKLFVPWLLPYFFCLFERKYCTWKKLNTNSVNREISKNTIFDEKVSILTKVSIFDENLDYWQKFGFLTKKFDFWPKISIFDQKFRFLTKNFDFWPKISIFDQKNWILKNRTFTTFFIIRRKLLVKDRSYLILLSFFVIPFF